MSKCGGLPKRCHCIVYLTSFSVIGFLSLCSWIGCSALMVYERVSGTQLIGMKINLTESILILTIVSAVTSCMFHRDVYSYGTPIQTINATVNATAVATFCHQTTYHFAVALVTVGHIIFAHLFSFLCCSGGIGGTGGGLLTGW